MQISNSNIQAAFIANQTSRSKQNRLVNGVVAKQEAQPSQENKALNKKSNSTGTALIYEFGGASKPSSQSPDRENQKDSQITLPEFDSGLQHVSKNNNKYRGTLVSENHNFVVATAIDTYSRHQELEHSEHVSQVVGIMGIDLYA